MGCEELCDNGHACGLCLMAVPHYECPDAARETHITLRQNCKPMHVNLDELCEADGWCGTSDSIDNCLPRRDIYRRVDCSSRWTKTVSAELLALSVGLVAVFLGMAVRHLLLTHRLYRRQLDVSAEERAEQQPVSHTVSAVSARMVELPEAVVVAVGSRVSQRSPIVAAAAEAARVHECGCIGSQSTCSTTAVADLPREPPPPPQA